MGGCFSQSVARSTAAALLVLVAACSGGSGGSGQRPKPSASSTTAPAATIDLSKPIPGGSLHGTPRPPLENTGNDYVAITRSLIANLRWISENPEPRLIADVFVPGTPGHDQRTAAYQFLVDNGYRWADEGYHLIAVEVIDDKQNVVSVRVTQELEFERLVDASGNQVGQTRAGGGRKQLTYLLTSDDQRWRIGGGSTEDGSTVEL